MSKERQVVKAAAGSRTPALAPPPSAAQLLLELMQAALQSGKRPALVVR
jgi:hypothetical protein